MSFVATTLSGISCFYDIVRISSVSMGPIRLGSEKVLGPIRLRSEKVRVRVVPEILGPSRLGSELSDIR